MKLSEAIRLGAMAIPQTTGFDGCAIGAAVYAIGRNHFHTKEYDTVKVVSHKVWPWLDQPIKHPITGVVYAVDVVIGDLNGFRILNWDRNRIADWVATIEPQDDVVDVPQIEALAYDQR